MEREEALAMTAAGRFHSPVGIVGYGEVGKIIGAELAGLGSPEVHTWDVNFDDPHLRLHERSHAEEAGVNPTASLASLLDRASYVFSVVTASQTVDAARAAGRSIREGTVYVDMNSASPAAKVEAARCIEEGGGRYVEAAIMASVPARRLGVPILLGGRHAIPCAEDLTAWGFNVRPTSEQLGVVSATKMCRSMVVKGLEAIVIEALTAARAHGVEEAVLHSLDESFPGMDWEDQADGFFHRAILHGRRRSEEMKEAARTAGEAGIGAFMSEATARRQEWMADLAEEGVFTGESPALWRASADRIRRHLASRQADPSTHAGE